uniref:ShKT domain-containing protein n=1 Tax=Caenorhabditis tropicalis TaxID=1561998 RepID=A0A1I7T8L7_9PELO
MINRFFTSSSVYFSIVISLLSTSSDAKIAPKCRDTDMNCAVWVASNSSDCENVEIVSSHCLRTCGACGDEIDPKYDVRRLPPKLKSIAWMVGRWRSEFGGKAFFPTIPKFTYGEQVDISIADNSDETKTPLLNYTAFAWDINMPDGDPTEIHSENGYIAVDYDKEQEKEYVSMNTAMSNGEVLYFLIGKSILECVIVSGMVMMV